MCLFKDIYAPCDHPECEIVMTIYMGSAVSASPAKTIKKSSAPTASSIATKETDFKRPRCSGAKQLEQFNDQENPEQNEPHRNQQKISNNGQKQSDSEETSVSSLKKQLLTIRNNQLQMMKQIEIMSGQMSKIMELHLQSV